MKKHQPVFYRHFLAAVALALLALQPGTARQRDTLVTLPWGATAAPDRTSVSSAVVTGLQLEKTPYRDAIAGLTGLIPGLEESMGGNCALTLGSKGLATANCIIDDVPLGF